MKVIKVENQVEGGKVAFEILKEKLVNGAPVSYTHLTLPTKA